MIFNDLKVSANEINLNGYILLHDSDSTSELIRGIEHKDKGTTIQSNTVFPVASVTKFLTALAIGQLIDQNCFTLDTSIKDILPSDVFFYDSSIQVKHLLSHTSGMPDYLDESSDESIEIDNRSLLHVRDYLKYFPKTKMEFTSGSTFKYHNGAYVYLALIIEKVTQLSYQTYINTMLLQPLGITNSGIFLASENRLNQAMGYVDLEANQNHLGLIPEMAGGDGGAYLNPHDFYQIIQAFKKGSILSPSLVKEFTTPFTPVSVIEDLYYGYGLWLKKSQNQYIPFVVGEDVGIQCKAIFSMTDDRFYWISTNTLQDIHPIVNLIDTIAFHENE
jgi:CubicO group peptidase (beta-lactamase class C family)